MNEVMDKKMNMHARQNMVYLRRRLKISQGEFISRYLVDAEGNKLLSVPRLSAIENGNGGNLKVLVASVAEKLDMDESLFWLEQNEFAQKLDDHLKSMPGQKSADAADVSELLEKSSQVETIVQYISDWVIDGIMSGRWKAGDKLPSDRELARKLNVSRSTLREAMKVLDVMGLVNILHGQGTFIAQTGSNFLMAPLSWTFLIGNEDISNVLMLRNMLECNSARQAALNKASGKDFSALTNAFEDVSRAADAEAFLEGDVAFHRVIADLCGNTVISNLLATIRRITRYISSTGVNTPQELQESNAEHKALYLAIMSGDPQQAEQAMRNHMESSRSRYRIPERKRS